MYKSSYTGSQIDEAVAKANEAAPQSTTYTKNEVDSALSGKQATLVVGTNLDSAPTENSTNPVTSGGVYQAINVTSYTTPTVNSSLTLQSGGYCKIGSICIVNLRFTENAALPSGSVLFSGLPAPVKASGIQADRILCSVSNSKLLEINLTSSNEIKLGESSLEGNGETVVASVVYLCE